VSLEVGFREHFRKFSAGSVGLYKMSNAPQDRKAELELLGMRITSATVAASLAVVSTAPC